MGSCTLPAGPQGHKSPGLQLTLHKRCFVFSGTWTIPARTKEISPRDMHVMHVSNLPSGAIFCGSSCLKLGKVRDVGKTASGISLPGLVSCVHEWVIQTKQVQGSARTWMEGCRTCHLRGSWRTWIF